MQIKLRQFFQVSETSMQSRNEAGIFLSLIYNSKSTRYNFAKEKDFCLHFSKFHAYIEKHSINYRVKDLGDRKKIVKLFRYLQLHTTYRLLRYLKLHPTNLKISQT